MHGLDSVPAHERPTVRQVNVGHLAWDVKIGLETLLLSAWYGGSWIVRRRVPRSRWFLRAAARSGVLALIAMEVGWVVTEVGRQPWIVHEYMKYGDAATSPSLAGGLLTSGLTCEG